MLWDLEVSSDLTLALASGWSCVRFAYVFGYATVHPPVSLACSCSEVHSIAESPTGVCRQNSVSGD